VGWWLRGLPDRWVVLPAQIFPSIGMRGDVIEESQHGGDTTSYRAVLTGQDELVEADLHERVPRLLTSEPADEYCLVTGEGHTEHRPQSV